MFVSSKSHPKFEIMNLMILLIYQNSDMYSEDS